MYVHSVHCILHNVHLQTSIYCPFLEDCRKTLVTTDKLIVKPWMSLVNSYRKCWTSDISYIWEVLSSMWKQSSWEIFLSQGKRKAGGCFKEEEKKRKKKLSLCRVQGWNPRMTFQCEVLQTAKTHSNSGHNTDRKYKSAWDFSKQRESLLPTEHFRGWRELWHCKW